MSKLNEARIRALKPGPKDTWHGDGGGLWLRVRAGGSKTFVIRSKRGGVARVKTLGNWPQESLKTARAAAAAFQANGGRVPAAVTVGELAKEWYTRVILAAYRRPHHIRGYLDRALIPDLGARRVAELTRTDIAASVKAYSSRGAVGANRYLAIVKQVFAYAAEAGYVETSPAQALTRRIAGGAERSRARTLDDAEIRALWYADCRQRGLLRFLLLTLARIGEAQRARWRHVDGERWTIPAQNAKNKREHWITLAPLALDILGQKRAPDALLFPYCTPTNVQAWMRRWCAREGFERFTPHDLRRTGATRMADLGVAPHVIERVLNHTMQGVMAVYNHAEYAEERRAASCALAERLAAIVGRGDG